MSRGNMETIRAFYERWDRGDVPGFSELRISNGEDIALGTADSRSVRQIHTLELPLEAERLRTVSRNGIRTRAHRRIPART